MAKNSSQVWAFTEAGPQEGVSAPAQTTIGTTAVTLLAANPLRRGLIIANTGLTVIKLVLGLGTPTQTVYHLPLKACAVADDGSGGTYIDDAWTGAVQVISSGVGGTVVTTEILATSTD